MNYNIALIAIHIAKAMLAGYIISSIIIAIGICNVYKDISGMAYIYSLINRINFADAIRKPKFLLNGLTYAYVYIVASIRLRITFGSNYKKIILNLFDLCLELSKYGTSNFEEAMSMYMKEKEPEENEKE